MLDYPLIYKAGEVNNRKLVYLCETTDKSLNHHHNFNTILPTRLIPDLKHGKTQWKLAQCKLVVYFIV